MHILCKIALFFLLFVQSYAKSEFIKEPIFNESTFVSTYGNKSNDVLVFVHGLGDEASFIWLKTIERLKDKYFIITFDLPGFGKSEKSNRLYSPLNYSKFIHNVVNLYTNKSFHLIGHSMGATISLKYASLYNNLKSLVLIDAAGILNKVSYSKFLVEQKAKSLTNNEGIIDFMSALPNFIDTILPIDIDTVLNNNISRKIFFASNPSKIAAASLVEENFSNILNKIDLNTLIIWGQKDKVAPLQTGYALNKRLIHSKLEILENSSHVPMSDDFDSFILVLKKHLLNYKTKYQKGNINLSNVKNRSLIIDSKNNIVLEGKYKNLVIKNSKNIRFINSSIDNLIVQNSDIKIINSNINLNEKSSVINSNIKFISSNLNINKVKSTSSNYDFIAVDIKTKSKMFEVTNNSLSQTLSFSLSTKNRQTLHKVITLSSYKID